MDKRIRIQNPVEATEELKRILSLDATRGLKIRFENGVYHFRDQKAAEDFDGLFRGVIDYDTLWGKPDFPYNKGLVLDSCEGIDIDFGGSTIVMHGLLQAFSVVNCRDVTIRNLNIEWGRSPFSIGAILSHDGQSIRIKAGDDFPLRGGEPVWAIMDYDPIGKHLGRTSKFRNMDSLRIADNDTFELRGDFSGKEIIDGNLLIMRHIGNYRPCFHLLGCEGIVFDNVTIRQCPGMGIVAHYCKNITLRKMAVKPKAGYIMSSNTDATHFISCSGLISLEECYFEGMGDDAINVHGFYQTMLEISPDRKTAVSTLLNENGVQDMMYDAPSPGDEVEISRPANLLPFACNEVETCVVDSAKWQAVTRFKKPLEASVTPGCLYTRSSDLARLRFVNCTVRDIRARAALVQTRGCLIENCLFSHCTGTGVHIDTATGWWESIGARDVVIRNNAFERCGYGDGTYKNACGVAVLTECDEAAAGVHKDITIEGNRIVGNGNSTGIYVSSADNVKIFGNSIEGCDIAVEVDDSTGVEISGNRYAPPI